MSEASRTWIGRILIGLVLLINVQSAIVFWDKPERFAPAYELSGLPGEAAIKGLAVLFLMWNVPYVVALINPVRFRVSLYEAIAMQSIGLIGEFLILQAIPLEHIILRGSIWRFIIFDGVGLVALIVTTFITKTWQFSETCQV